MAIRITSLPEQEKQLQRSVEPKQEESTLSTLGRGALRTGARIAETALGTPGDILKTVGDIGVAAFNKVAPASVPEFFSPLPTSSQLRQGTQALTGQALEPHSSKEKFLDEFVSDVTALSLPSFAGKGKVVSQLGTNLKKAFGVAGAGNLAGFLSEELGASPEAAKGIKIGTMLATSIGGSGGINKAINKAYAPADKIPEGVKVSAKPALKKLTDLESAIKGRAFEGKDRIEAILNASINNFTGNDIDFKRAWELKKDFNTQFPKMNSIARTELRKVNKIFKQDILDHASSVVKDKELSESLKSAAQGINLGDKLFQDLNTASKFRQWINENATFGKYISGGVLGHLLGLPATKIGVATATGQAAFNFLEPIIRSSEIRKTYGRILKAAAQENLPAFNKNIIRMDKQLQKEYPELVQEYKLPARKIKITSLG